MDAIHQGRYHRMRPSKNFGQSEYVGREGAVDSVDLWGKNDKNWRDIHVEYIDVWDHKMKFSPIHEPFFSSNIAACLEWFRVASNPYMLSVEAKSRQLYRKRE
ncbi:hypothetical protein GOBAR_AA08914 [Gossypium barbadense]|uniref:Uncharacterized protein n=1 Tax=Gossypium barbadense TaxID=3634 RepID=A0A2P5Y831_GOSBA|nr:hypothetical protein GOBAR_AA08914 [Gossypium barbadense]